MTIFSIIFCNDGNYLLHKDFPKRIQQPLSKTIFFLRKPLPEPYAAVTCSRCDDQVKWDFLSALHKPILTCEVGLC